jgi:hypothetical protein
MPLSRMAQPQAPNGQQPPNGQPGAVPTIDPLGPPAGERERVDAEHLAQQLQDRAMSGMNETRKGNPA